MCRKGYLYVGWLVACYLVVVVLCVCVCVCVCVFGCFVVVVLFFVVFLGGRVLCGFLFVFCFT